MKEKFIKKYLRRLRAKLNGRNKVMTVDTWAVSLMRYGAGILIRDTEGQTEGPESL